MRGLVQTCPIQLIVGLGNPGDQYSRTRHNVGRWFVEALACWHHADWRLEKKFHGYVAELSREGGKVRLLAPSVFMNNSGDAVNALAQFYQIPSEAILIVHDDLDFPAGALKLKQGGGHGGHNGLRHIIACLSSGEFWRIRLGIGHPGHKDLVHDYVLHAPPVNDEASIRSAIDKGLDVLNPLLEGDFQLAMRQLHQTGE